MAFGGVKGTLSGNALSITNPMNATGSVSVAVGDLLICVVGERTLITTTGVTDNLGHTYTAQDAGIDGGNGTAIAFWKIATSAGTLTTQSAACTASADDCGIVGAVYEGPYAASPLDKSPAGVSDSLTPWLGPATGVLSQADELALFYFGTGNGATGCVCSAGTVDAQAGTGTGSGTSSIALARLSVGESPIWKNPRTQ